MTTDFEAAHDLIAETREHLEEAIDALRMLSHEVPEMQTRIEVYLIATLEQAVSDDNEWLGGSNSANLAALENELTVSAGDDTL